MSVGEIPPEQSLIEYPSAFPIKVMGAQVEGFTEAIVAIAQQFDPGFDAATGKLVWGYQYVPHDPWDLDAASPPILADVTGKDGRTLLVPAVMLFLTELPQARSADFSSLKHITYGTAPIAPDLLKRCIEILRIRF